MLEGAVMKLDDLIELWKLVVDKAEGSVLVTPAVAKATLEHLQSHASITEGINGILELIERKHG